MNIIFFCYGDFFFFLCAFNKIFYYVLEKYELNISWFLGVILVIEEIYALPYYEDCKKKLIKNQLSARCTHKNVNKSIWKWFYSR